jgi:hypothetical protein
MGSCKRTNPRFLDNVIPAQVEDTLQGAGIQAQDLDSRLRGSDNALTKTRSYTLSSRWKALDKLRHSYFLSAP